MGAMIMWWFFFFQAEDGIRDADVTGVQTCALPISRRRPRRRPGPRRGRAWWPPARPTARRTRRTPRPDRRRRIASAPPRPGSAAARRPRPRAGPPWWGSAERPCRWRRPPGGRPHRSKPTGPRRRRWRRPPEGSAHGCAARRRAAAWRRGRSAGPWTAGLTPLVVALPLRLTSRVVTHIV